MPEHETKQCPRCKNNFECKMGSILICQCSQIQLSKEQRAKMAEQYDDCLCIQCLRELNPDVA